MSTLTFLAVRPTSPSWNYLVLKAISSRLNVVKANTPFSGEEPGSWGGSPHLSRRGNALFDGDRPLRYLHWAGAPMRTGGPYRDLWEHYRYRNAPQSQAAALIAQAHKQIQVQAQAFGLQRLKSKLRKAVSSFTGHHSRPQKPLKARRQKGKP